MDLKILSFNKTLFKKDFNYYLITKNHIEHFSE
jgi:hypothetical protein